jgi:GntR family transcriptional regulator, transcriptional repressor for pyruvate dehydrogenase complex
MSGELGLPPVSGRSKAERVAQTLEQHIRDRELTPGTFLGTKAMLRAELGISPVTLDTALGILSDRGLVDIRPGVKGGVRVAAVQPSLFMGRARWPVSGGDDAPRKAGQAMALYLALQSHIVARAVSAASVQDKQALRRARARLRSATTDLHAYHQAHLALHRCLLDAAHDDVLHVVLDGLVATLDSTVGPPAVDESSSAQAWIADRIAVHVAVVDAVLERDLDAAWTALLEHGVTVDDTEADRLILPPGAIELEQRWARSIRTTAPQDL